MKYFCWERMMTGQWAPKFYHGAPPEKQKESKDDLPSRTPIIPCEDDATFEEAALLLSKPTW